MRALRLAAVLAVAGLFYGATNLYVQYVGVGTIAALRLLPATFYQNAYVQGFRTTNDNGQGTFVYTGSATCTDNGGTLIQAVGGCYQRDTSGPWQPAWFGAYADGSHDDTTVLNAFYAAIPAGVRVQWAPSRYLISDTVTIGISSNTVCPPGGGINMSGATAGLKIMTSNVSVSAAQGCTANGPRTPLTGADYVQGNDGIRILGTSGTHITNIAISGLTLTNWKDSGIYTSYADNVTYTNLNIQYVSYSGILWEASDDNGAQFNYVFWVGSSNGPGASSLPAGTKTNAYGITCTVDASGNLSHRCIIANNWIDMIPTWHGVDTHAGQSVLFLNNIITNVQTGVQITTDGSSQAARDVTASGNVITCAPLGSAIYPGGASSSVGGAGIYIAGVNGSILANAVRASNNWINSCASSENGTSPNAAIEVGNAQVVDISHNQFRSNRYRAIQTFGFMTGQITGNEFNANVAGPLASGNILIDVQSTTTQLLLSQNWGNSSSTDGYCVPNTIGGTVGVARDNTFFNLSNLYNVACGGNANRTDLGATAP